MKWLVTGANGMLGDEFVKALSRAGIDHIGVGRDDLDITDEKAVTAALATHQPTHIVNCAAWIDGETAESHPNEVFAVNADALSHFTCYVTESGALLINISTDYVFDGEKKTPYLTTDEVNPLNVYGASKLAGERLLAKLAPSHSVSIRTSWLMGNTERNFGSRMATRARAGEEVRVVEDQRSAPTFCDNLAANVVQTLSAKRITGIHHVVNAGDASRYELAREIYREVGADINLVTAVKSSEIVTNMVRPHYSVLDGAESVSAGFASMMNWREAFLKSPALAMWRSL